MSDRLEPNFGEVEPIPEGVRLAIEAMWGEVDAKAERIRALVKSHSRGLLHRQCCPIGGMSRMNGSGIRAEMPCWCGGGRGGLTLDERFVVRPLDGTRWTRFFATRLEAERFAREDVRVDCVVEPAEKD